MDNQFNSFPRRLRYTPLACPNDFSSLKSLLSYEQIVSWYRISSLNLFRKWQEHIIHQGLLARISIEEQILRKHRNFATVIQHCVTLTHLGTTWLRSAITWFQFFFSQRALWIWRAKDQNEKKLGQDIWRQISLAQYISSRFTRLESFSVRWACMKKKVREQFPLLRKL